MSRKFVAFTLVFVFVCILAGCKKRPPPPPPAPPTPAVTPTPTTPTVEQQTMQPIPEASTSELSDDLDKINKSGLLKKIYFEFDRSELRADATATLDANATNLKKYSNLKIRIEGHCDERGTEEYNISLGERRAKVAYQYLVNVGVSPSRMEIVTYGKSQPEDPGHNEDAWSRNRRDVFLVIAK